MRIGIIAEGVSEYESFPIILNAIEEDTGHAFKIVSNPFIQPGSPLGKKARECKRSITSLDPFHPDLVILLLDRDSDSRCPGTISSELQSALSAMCKIEVLVVIKDNCYENWIVADPDCISKSKIFTLSKTAIRSIGRNNADNVDALSLLKISTKAKSYDKRRHSVSLLQNASYMTMSMNSRSFRKFLRAIRHPLYVEQSKNPNLCTSNN